MSDVTKLLAPPANEVPVFGDGTHTQPWANYHTSVADHLRRMPGEMRRGVTDGSDAAAGDIGEYLEASFEGPVTLPDGVAVDVGTLPLEAGDWDVSGTLVYASTSSNMRIIQAWVGSAPVTAHPFGLGRAVLVTSSPVLATGIQLVTGSRRLSLPGPGTAYLSGIVVSTSGVVTASGMLAARRAR